MKLSHQIVRFGIAGIVGFAVDAGILYAALALGAGPYPGRLISFLCAVFATWQINRRYTFPGQRARTLWREWHEYLAAMAFGGACNYGAYALAIAKLPSGRGAPLIAVAIGSIAGMFVNFISAKKLVFRR